MNDDTLTTILGFFNVNLGADNNRSTSRFIGLTDSRLAHDYAAGWKIRSWQHLHQLFSRSIRILHQQMNGVNYLA